MKEYKYFIGIDVAKYKFDIYNSINNKYDTILNKKDCMEELIDNINKLIEDNNKDNNKISKNDILIVIDLTGGYEKLIRNTFYERGYTNILLAEGLKVKNFNKSTKYNRAKTDKQDCFILAEYGKAFYKELKLYEPIEEIREEIKTVYTRIEDLKDLLKREKTRLKQPNNNNILKESILNNIEHLKEEIERLKNYILSIINNNKTLNTIYNTLIQEKGIGEELALFLLIKIKELGHIERKQLTSICGLAPLANDSGTFNGHRYVRGGRRDIRSKLFLCLMNMVRFDTETNKKINNNYLKRGKNKKVAILSLARKKIAILNAKVRDALVMEGYRQEKELL